MTSQIGKNRRDASLPVKNPIIVNGIIYTPIAGGYIIAINYSWITIFFSLIIALITAAVCKIEALPFVLESPTRKKL